MVNFLLVICISALLVWVLRIKKLFLEKNNILEASTEKLNLFEDLTSRLEKKFTKENLELKSLEEKLFSFTAENAALKEANARLCHDKEELINQIQEYSNKSKNFEETLQKSKEKYYYLEAIKNSLQISKDELSKAAKERESELEKKLELSRKENSDLTKSLAAQKEQDPIRKEEHRKCIEILNVTMQNLETERVRNIEEKKANEANKLAALRETWSRHESEVRQKMSLICQELIIDYIDKEKFPFSGKPDNSVKICGEYVIFDAKSPQGEDLKNFPAYVKAQAEQVKKYLKNEEVKKDIYFVVPQTAIRSINDTFIQFDTHRIHIITIDALKPILIQLKKIEEYEFIEILSPEQREEISTHIGQMWHLIKRRIQIDCGWHNSALPTLSAGENLPDEILKGAKNVEKSSLFNPPNHKRTKRIDVSSLKKDTEKLFRKIPSLEIPSVSVSPIIDQIHLLKEKKEGIINYEERKN